MSSLILLAVSFKVFSTFSRTSSTFGFRGLSNLPSKFSSCLLSYNLQKNSKNSPHLIFIFFWLSWLLATALSLVIIIFFVFCVRITTNEFTPKRQEVFVKDDFVEAVYSLVIIII